MDFLVRQILPRLGSDARLLILGRCAPRPLLHPRMHRAGFVPDLRPYLAAADVAVNPVGYGTGVNVKLAEYLAAGLPVVSTTVGVRGFAGPTEGIRVVARQDFARALTGDLPSAVPRAALAPLSWDSLGRRLLARYEGLFSPASPGLDDAIPAKRTVRPAGPP